MEDTVRIVQLPMGKLKCHTGLVYQQTNFFQAQENISIIIFIVELYYLGCTTEYEQNWKYLLRLCSLLPQKQNNSYTFSNFIIAAAQIP